MSKRYIELNNDALYDLVEKKGVLVEEGRALNATLEKKIEEIKSMETDLREKAEAIEEVKKEIRPLVDECMKEQELGEFDVVESTDIKGDQLRVGILDALANWKDNFRNKIKPELEGNQDQAEEELEEDNK